MSKKKMPLSTRAIVKRKKKYKIRINLRDPSEFQDEYEYFVHVANEFNLKIYHYESTCFWKGPAIIMKQKRQKQLNIIEKMRIDVSVDILDEDNQIIAIYPQTHCKNDTIKYEYFYKKNEEPIELVEWIFNEMKFHLDKTTNIVYEYDTDIPIGKKVYRDDQFTLENLY